jgi:hypothetical protein
MQRKNTSRTDFWISPSKKIAGAYNASIRPAAIPARRETKRSAASASKTQDAEPTIACTTRTSSKCRPAIV